MSTMYAEHGREVLGIGEEYHLASVACKDATKKRPESMEVTFYIAPLLADGKVAWKYKDAATKKVAAFTEVEHHAWVRAWELRTGKCSACAKDRPGEEWIGWSQETGHHFQTCRRCKGTNKSVAA